MQFGDWAAAYRLFGKGRVDRDALFGPAVEAALGALGPGDPLVVAMADTLIRKRGRKVHGAAWRRDPLGPPFHTNFTWSQRFVQISAALPDKSCPGRARGIPADFVHAPTAAKPRKGSPPEAWAEYRARRAEAKASAVGASRLKALAARAGGRRVACAVGGGYTNKTMFRGLAEGVALIPSCNQRTV
jgi:hypothetical protein